MPYVMLVPGDNDLPAESIRALVAAIGQADVVYAYPLNPEVRPWGRRILSWLFVRLLNGLFGLRLRYYNGPALFRTEDVRSCRVTTSGFLYHAEIMVQLMKSGASCIETGMINRPRAYGRSKAVRVSSFVDAARTLSTLLARGLWQRRIVPLPRVQGATEAKP